MKTPFVVLALLALTAGCGGGAPSQSNAPVRVNAATGTANAIVDPAALYCQGTGGSVIPRVSGGRRADLCRLSDGRTVTAADWMNSHNDL